MRQPSLRIGLLLAAATLGLSAATADTIYLIDGSAVSDIRVRTESFKEIEYKDGSKTRTVKTDRVLRIDFSGKSQLVDRADTAATDGQFFDALADLQTYVDGQLSSDRTPRYRWELAYAMFRLIELNRVVGDAPALIAAADKLIEHAPESRYVPMAFLAKAEVQHLTGKGAAAKKTLDEFKNLVQGKSLSGRWVIEQKLASALYDSSLKGKKLRDMLDGISTEAGGQYPVVRSRAKVAIGESFLQGKNFKEAELIFAHIAKNPKADSRTLAAAYTGLGDCIFKRAVVASGKAKEGLLRDAQLAYMRVVVVYKDETLYVPKAMYWAGRVFDEAGGEADKEKAQKLYGRVMREYQGTTWASEANSFRKR